MESTCIFPLLVLLYFCQLMKRFCQLMKRFHLAWEQPETSSRCQVGGKKNYSVRYETSVMVSWHQWKDMKRWTLGKQHRFHVSSMATEYQWGELVREALCLTVCVCLIWPFSRTLPRPAVRLPTCLSKAISLTGLAPAATTLAIKSVINTSILNLLLILYHHESFLPFFFSPPREFIYLSRGLKPVANGPGCWQGA